VKAVFWDDGDPEVTELKRIYPNTVNQTANVKQGQRLKASIFICAELKILVF